VNERWSWSIGERGNRVRVYERADKDDVLHLYFFEDGRQRQESLKRKLRTARGSIDRQVERWAREQCTAKHDILVARAMGIAPSALPPPTRQAMTVSEAIREVQDADRGLYPHDTPHRREVLAALEYAKNLWGGTRTWNTLGRDDLRQLGRRRIRELVRQGHKGVRGAEVTVSRVLAVAAWLRDEGKIHDTACLPPRRWKAELATFWKDEVRSPTNYKPARPRHTAHELRAIVDHSWHVDPRFGLMSELGFSLRLGQVRLSRRSDVDLLAGTFTVHGDGKKEGAVIQLNDLQLEALQKALGGYLRVLEATEADYHLFPGGRLRKAVAHADKGPCSRGVVAKWFKLAEKLAGVAHVRGRAAYGLRRQAVDGTEELKVSDRARQIAGGWKDIQTPNTIYADQQPKWALKEASEALRRIRLGGQE
jgi:hypothetical protein